jgi:predicted SnoaL-like aldol condensation-catalyzing enzyme
MKFFVSTTAATALILCIAFSSNLFAKENKMEISNKDKAVALITSLQTGDPKGVSYINPNKYIQHNLAVADGLAGFGEVIKNAPPGGFKANVVRAYQDGDYAFLHTVYDFFGAKIGFDILRFENGLIVEHWDNLIDVFPANQSGHTQTDGSTKSIDLDKTEANKVIVENFISTILMKGEMDKIGNFIDAGTEDYIQHNPGIPDGLSGLGGALEGMAKQGITMVYSKIHKVLGEGNFVLAISEGSFADKATSFYDLFRVENGKIVEHWDVMETILPKPEWKNSNGKFNFPN